MVFCMKFNAEVYSECIDETAIQETFILGFLVWSCHSAEHEIGTERSACVRWW